MNDVHKRDVLDTGESTVDVENPRRYVNMILLVFVIGIVVFAVVLGLQLSPQNQTRPTSGLAPDFELELFDGTHFKLSDYRGQVVLVNFWGSWCGPCREEAPELQALYEDYKDQGFTIIGVNWLETSRENALDFVDEFGITYPNGEDIDERVASKYHIQGAPENFIIDQNGNVHHFVIGFARYDSLRDTIQPLLAQSS